METPGGIPTRPLVEKEHDDDDGDDDDDDDDDNAKPRIR